MKTIMPKETVAIDQELAFHYLARNGYKILLRNYECPLGEIDLIAKENGGLVFVSVNKRTTPKVVKIAKYYLHRYGINVSIRFDSVQVNSDCKIGLTIYVIKNDTEAK